MGTMFFRSLRHRSKIGIGIGAIMILTAVQTASWAGPASSGTPAGPGQKTFVFNISSKPLPQALTDFGNVTGLAILYTQEQPYKLTAPALSGLFTAAEALDRLLAGSGYTYRFSDPHTVTLDALPPGSAKNAMMLPTLKVQAKGGVSAEIETGGAANGYVATHDFAAEKTNTPIVEVPQAISVVTQEQMQQQDVQTVQQALQYTAGVATSQNDAFPRLEAYTVRGFYPFIYQDGMLTDAALDNAVLHTEPFGLDRVEVLKGPSSVLYGQNVPGGLVDEVSKRPTEDPLHFFQLQGGSFGRVQGEFDLSGPIDSGGTLLYRLTGLARSSGQPINYAPDDRIFIAPALTWHPNEHFTITFLSRYQNDTQGWPNYLPAQGTVEPNPNGYLPVRLNSAGPYNSTFRGEDYAIGYLAEYRLNDIFTFRQNFRYEGAYSDWGSIFLDDLEPDLRTADQSSAAYDVAYTAITLDNQAMAKFATGPVSHTAIVGVDYWRQNLDEQAGFGNAPSLDLYNPIYLPVPRPPLNVLIQDQVGDEVGLYFQDQLKWRRFVLLLSGREDWAHTGVGDKLAKTHTGQDDSKFSGRVGGLYLFDSGVAPYVSYSTVFQPNIGTDFAGNPFQPTTGDQVEVGAKYKPPEINALLTLSLFDINQQNVLTLDPVHPDFELATGGVRSRGVEVETVASLARGLNMIGSYTYLDLTNTKTNDPTQGNTPYAQPKHMGSMWLYYTFQKGLLEGFGIGGGVRYIGSTWDYTNSIETPNVTLVDAAASYQIKGIKVSANVTNLLDKKYVSFCASSIECRYGSQLSVIGGASYAF